MYAANTAKSDTMWSHPWKSLQVPQFQRSGKSEVSNSFEKKSHMIVFSVVVVFDWITLLKKLLLYYCDRVQYSVAGTLYGLQSKTMMNAISTQLLGKE